MKMDQIKYREIYTDEVGNGKYYGFEPYIDDEGYQILERHVICYADYYTNGSMVTFEIVDFGVKDFKKTEFRREKVTYYDRFNENCKILIDNLASQQLRGKIAENTVEDLFYKLFCYSNVMKKYLPKLVNYRIEQCKKYNWPIDCGKFEYNDEDTGNSLSLSWKKA